MFNTQNEIARPITSSSCLHLQLQSGNKAKMDPKGSMNASSTPGDRELIDLDEAYDDEYTRKRLRDWALEYSTGDVPAGTIIPKSNIISKNSLTKNTTDSGASEPSSQTSSSPSKEGRKSDMYEFPEWTQHLAEAAGMKKYPSPSPSRYRHTRQRSSHSINVAAIPGLSSPLSRLGSNVPPVPPIPEKYREEWESQQEMKRHSGTTEPNYPIMDPDEDEDTSKYIRKPQPAYPARSGDAARRANDRRQKVFNTVVLEDVQEEDDMAIGKGKENERAGGSLRSSFEERARRRSDVRLPRSPGMLNLAHQRAVELGDSPDKDWDLYRLPEPLIPYDSGVKAKDEKKNEDQGVLHRPLGDMNKTYADARDPASEAFEMGFETGGEKEA